jgi:hypothetical protein
MTDRSDSLTHLTPADSVGEGVPAPHVESVADRLQALEAQVVALQDHARLEQILAERVIARVKESRALPPAGPPAPAGFSAHAAAFTTPAGVTRAITAVTAALPSSAVGVASAAWSRLGFLREFRLIFGMYFDARYRVSRVTQLAAPGVIALMVANYVFFNWFTVTVPILTPVLERGILVILAVVLYKVLSREAGRYSDVLAYLAHYNR